MGVMMHENEKEVTKKSELKNVPPVYIFLAMISVLFLIVLTGALIRYQTNQTPENVPSIRR